MTKVCLYFQIHQPYRLCEYNFFQIGKHLPYFNDYLNNLVLDKVSSNCYLPTNELFSNLIQKYNSKIKLNFAISGTVISQFEKNQPETLLSFQNLFKNPNIELISETFYHSLASVFKIDEFEFQIKKHQSKIEEVFNKKTTTFRNTELIFKNSLVEPLKNMGFTSILTEGVSRINSNFKNNTFLKSKNDNLKIHCRNYPLSDDIAFRFADPTHIDFPITAEKMIQKIKKQSVHSDYIFIGMDYETIGEHFKKEEGIFDFWEKFLTLIAKDKEIELCNFNEINFNISNAEEVSFDDFISWADTEKDISAWMGNSLQYEALRKIYELQKVVFESNNESFFEIWRNLQTSDHFYYMSTKHQNDGEVHSYFSPFNTPYDAYVYFMNIISDFELLLQKK